jgi:hypothetical protein
VIVFIAKSQDIENKNVSKRSVNRDQRKMIQNKMVPVKLEK